MARKRNKNGGGASKPAKKSPSMRKKSIKESPVARQKVRQALKGLSLEDLSLIGPTLATGPLRQIRVNIVEPASTNVSPAAESEQDHANVGDEPGIDAPTSVTQEVENVVQTPAGEPVGTDPATSIPETGSVVSEAELSVDTPLASISVPETTSVVSDAEPSAGTPPASVSVPETTSVVSDADLYSAVFVSEPSTAIGTLQTALEQLASDVPSTSFDTASTAATTEVAAEPDDEFLREIGLPDLMRHYGGTRLVVTRPNESWKAEAPGAVLIMDAGVRATVRGAIALVPSNTPCTVRGDKGARIVVLAKRWPPASEPATVRASNITLLPGSSLTFEAGSHFPGLISLPDAVRVHPSENADILRPQDAAHVVLHSGLEATDIRMNPGTLFELLDGFPEKWELQIPVAARVLVRREALGLVPLGVVFADTEALVVCGEGCVVFHKADAVIERKGDFADPPKVKLIAEITDCHGVTTIVEPGEYEISEILDRGKPQPPVTDTKQPFALNPDAVAIRVTPSGSLDSLKTQASDGTSEPEQQSIPPFQAETIFQPADSPEWQSESLAVSPDAWDEMVLVLTSETVSSCQLKIVADSATTGDKKEVIAPGPPAPVGAEALPDDDEGVPFEMPEPTVVAAGPVDDDDVDTGGVRTRARGKRRTLRPETAGEPIIYAANEVGINGDYVDHHPGNVQRYGGILRLPDSESKGKMVVFDRSTPLRPPMEVSGPFRVDPGYGGSLRTTTASTLGDLIGVQTPDRSSSSDAFINVANGKLSVHGFFDGTIRVSALTFTRERGVFECGGGGTSVTDRQRQFGIVHFLPGSSLPMNFECGPGANIYWGVTTEKFLAPPGIVVVAQPRTTVVAGPFSIVLAMEGSTVERMDASSLIITVPEAKVIAAPPAESLADPPLVTDGAWKGYEFSKVQVSLERPGVSDFDRDCLLDSEQVWAVDHICLPGEEPPDDEEETFIFPSKLVVVVSVNASTTA